MRDFTIYTASRPTLYEAEALQAELDRLENVALHYRRVARRAKLWRTLRSLIDGDGFFLVTGALIAADIGFLLIYLAVGGR